jgi:hypothetical protein
MVTLADKLEEFGFSSSSYEYNKNGSRISAYCERPLQSGLYAGWKTFPSSPIVIEVEWDQILKKNQKIKISDKFQSLKPLVLRNSIFRTTIFNLFVDITKPKQFNHSNLLEFQNILVSMENGNVRPTRTGDVYSFDFDSHYRILKIDQDRGYMLICKDDIFEFIDPEIMNYEEMIFISTSLLTFVDYIELDQKDIIYDSKDKKIKSLFEDKIYISNKKEKDIESVLINKFIQGDRSKSLIISLLGILTNKNIEVNGQGVKYILSWTRGKSKINFNKMECINYIENKLRKKSHIK